MYDVGHDNTVSKQELTTLLNHVPKEAFASHDIYTPPAPPLLHRQGSIGEYIVVVFWFTYAVEIAEM